MDITKKAILRRAEIKEAYDLDPDKARKYAVKKMLEDVAKGNTKLKSTFDYLEEYANDMKNEKEEKIIKKYKEENK